METKDTNKRVVEIIVTDTTYTRTTGTKATDMDNKAMDTGNTEAANKNILATDSTNTAATDINILSVGTTDNFITDKTARTLQFWSLRQWTLQLQTKQHCEVSVESLVSYVVSSCYELTTET